jgi:electron transfer flavoprotein alpha subunit
MLVLAETDGQAVLPSTLPTVTFAQAFCGVTGGSFDILIVGGPEIAGEAEAWRGCGAGRVLVAALPELAHPTADRVAAVCVQIARQTGAASLAGPSSTFGRDVLPRIAALLDWPMLSDVLNVERTDSGLTFRRPMYAGNILATVRIAGENSVFSVRGTAYGRPEARGDESPVETVAVDAALLPQGTTWVGLDAAEQKRPELTTARVVVTGGRPLRDAETFERVIGGLADRLGGAVGATRAAVDSGIAPNEYQVGQTGKVVAPELYIAAGVSGSVQHLAGMKESKVIVAINTDPDAPIFQVADYGLVADLHQAVPELTAKL